MRERPGEGNPSIIRYPGIRHRYVEECGKIGFPNGRAAAAALARIARRPAKGEADFEPGRVPVQAYECDRCGCWHLTSAERAGTARMPRWMRGVGLPDWQVVEARRDGHRLAGGHELEVAGFVAGYVDRHAHGPLWSEVAVEFAWTSRKRGREAIIWLGLEGWLRFAAEPRSLRPGANWYFAARG